MNTAAIIVFLIFILAIIMVAYVAWTINKRKNQLSEADQKYFRKIIKNIDENSHVNHQILDADKLLDKLLSKRGIEGSLGEKLKKSKALFTNIDQVWSAHKLRNRIAHEIGVTVTKSEATNALRSFKKAYRDLGLKF